MKKLLLLIPMFGLMALSNLKADTIITYNDDGCPIYFRPGYGYFEACNNEAIVFLGGVDFDIDGYRHYHHHGFFGGHRWFSHGHEYFHGEKPHRGK